MILSKSSTVVLLTGTAISQSTLFERLRDIESLLDDELDEPEAKPKPEAEQQQQEHHAALDRALEQHQHLCLQLELQVQLLRTRVQHVQDTLERTQRERMNDLATMVGELRRRPPSSHIPSIHLHRRTVSERKLLHYVRSAQTII